MTDNVSLTSSAKVLATIKNLPIWLFFGIALSSAVLNLIPNLSLGWRIVVVFTILGICRSIDSIVAATIASSLKRETRPIKIIPKTEISHWSVTKQPDNSYTTAIQIYFDASNTSDTDLRIMDAKLLSPKVEKDIIQTLILIKNIANHLSSSQHTIHRKGTANGSITVIMRGELKGNSDNILKITILLTDQSGYKQKVKLMCKNLRPK